MVIPSCEIALLNLPKPLHHALPLHGSVGRSGNDSSQNQEHQKHPQYGTPNPFCREEPQNMLQLSKHQALHEKA